MLFCLFIKENEKRKEKGKALKGIDVAVMFGYKDTEYMIRNDMKFAGKAKDFFLFFASPTKITLLKKINYS